MNELSSNGDKLPRKLATILYADVAGYSRLKGEDEDATHHLLGECLDLISVTVISCRGKATRGVLNLKPEFNLKAFARMQPYENETDLKRLIAQLENAGFV